MAIDKVTSAAIADGAVSADTLTSTAITGQTAETTVADDDLVLLSDTSASAALKKMTVANLVANAGGGKVLGVNYSWSTIDETTTSSTFTEPASNNGRISYTTTGTDSNFLVIYAVNFKQTGNHPNYYYYGNWRYKIIKQSDSSTLATGNSRNYMVNINSGTLITNAGTTTQHEYLDPGSVASGTALYFQPQFSTQAELNVPGVALTIVELAP
jgi:hypothetical protein